MSVYIAPENLGRAIRGVAAALQASGTQVPPASLLYAEKRNGFSCRTCEYARPTNATHGRCEIMTGAISLDEGCCAAWAPDAAQLHLYKEP